jgi:hypothetical protein
MVTTRPNLDGYRSGFVANFVFIVIKSRHQLCSRVLVWVGIDITSTALTKLHSILIKKFQYMVTTRPNLDWYISGLIANFVFIAFKGRYELCIRVLVLVGIDITSMALTKLHSILTKKFQYMVTTRPNLDWFRSGLIANFVFIAFKSMHQLCSRVLVLVGMISQVRHLLSYILYLPRNFNIWSQLDPI